METLAYFHLALANEAPTEPDYKALISAWDSLIRLSRGAIHQLWNRPKLSTRAAVSLLSISIALGTLGMATQALALVQEGDRSAEVTAVQQRLQELGYFKANITGYFGSITKQAVIQFQQAKGLVPDGIVGTNTLSALGEKLQTSSKLVSTTSSKPIPQPKSTRESSRPLLQLGTQGADVNVLQESLAAAGFPGSSNGTFDAATQKAVMRFQQAKGLTVDGIVGPQTWAALPAIGGSDTNSNSSNSSRRPAPRATTRLPAPRITNNRPVPRATNNRPVPRASVNSLNTSRNSSSRSNTTALQKRLKELGFYNGEIDGIWGPLTQAALEAAQRSYDVSASDLDRGSI